MGQQHFGPLLMPHRCLCLAMPSHSAELLNGGDHECEETTKELIASQERWHACCSRDYLYLIAAILLPAPVASVYCRSLTNVLSSYSLLLQ